MEEQQERKKGRLGKKIPAGKKSKITILTQPKKLDDDKMIILTQPQELKTGGRAGYKGGKSVKKKSSGKAIRGKGCEIR